MDGFLTREKRVLSLFATSDFRPPEQHCTARNAIVFTERFVG
jgi:hypothetical protein